MKHAERIAAVMRKPGAVRASSADPAQPVVAQAPKPKADTATPRPAGTFSIGWPPGFVSQWDKP